MIKSKILSEIKPSAYEHEEFEKVVMKFKRKLKRASNKLGLKSDFFVGGSFGKGTYLKGTFDVDIFCRFDLSINCSSHCWILTNHNFKNTN